MTSPPVPIQQLPGVGDRIGAAIEPFLQAMRERNEREQRKQQLLIQMGQLKLQQDRDAEERKQTNEKRKGLEEMGAGLKQEIAKLNEPGPLTREIQGAMQSGDPQLMEATMTRVRRAGANERVMAVRQKYGEMAKQSGGQLTPDKQLALYDELLVADPDNPNAGAIANVANTLRASLKPKTAKWVKGQAEKQPDGTFRNVWRNLDSGEVRVGGAVSTPYTALIEGQGTVDQRSLARVSTQMRLAQNGMERIETESPDIQAEVAPMLAKLELAGNLSIPIVGKNPEVALRQFGLQELSPEAQEYMTHVFNWRAAKVFSDGGKQLTATEIIEAARGFMPFVGETDASKAAKRQQREDQTLTVENLAGGALKKARAGTSLENGRVSPERKPETPEQRRRRAAMLLEP